MTSTRGTIVRIALLLALTMGLATLAPSPVAAASRPKVKMLNATNTSRVNHSVRSVKIHWKISKLARKHSVAMARRDRLFHTADPDSFYLDGIRWSSWGENVGVTDGGVWGLQRAFMDSTLHRANILNRGFRRVAIGTYRDDDGFLWVTVFFYG